MIVKHRRGTTREWQEVNLDLIPEAGELVIEECDDGSRKCKIGTGYTRFSDLPYIDDKTKADLLAEIAEVKKYLKNRITDLNTDFQTELSDLEAELKVIETKCYELEKDYIVRDADIKVILEKNLEDAVNLLESKITAVSDSADEAQTGLQEKTARIEQLIMAAENRFETNLNEASDEFRAELYEATNDYIAKDEALDFSLRGHIADATAGLAATFNSKYNELNSNIDTLDEQVQVNTVNIANATRRISSLIVSDKNSLVSSDAEVADIRDGIDPENGYAVKTFDSAGDAVRAVGTGLVALDTRVENLKSDLSQYIGSKAVTGLHYDINGDVGQCKPYTLYLTAGREVLQNSGVQVLGGAGGGPGSGGSGGGYLEINYESPETGDVNIRLGDKSEIVFNFSGKDSSGDAIAQATATWSLDGVNIANTTVKKGANRFAITDYLPNVAGEYTLFLTVTDANQRFATKTWYVNVIELRVTADALDDKQHYTANEKLAFLYKPFGAIDKTAIIKLDNEIIHTEYLGDGKSGESIPYELPALAHGSHLLEIYLTADFDSDGIIDDSERSNSVLKDLIFIDNAVTQPVIGIANREISVDQYSTTKLTYTVYGPTESSIVDIYVDSTKVSTTVVGPNKDYNNTPTAVYPYFATTDGNHTIKFVCGGTEKTVNVKVAKVDADITPITAGLAFDFNPMGRNNGDLASRNWSDRGISMTVSNNFDWINGGYKPDDPDGPCFCIKAGSTATINYKPFQEEARVKGREFKLVFKTKNISNSNAVFLSCVDNRTATDHVGVEMGAYTAHIYGKTGNLELTYSEDDVIELEFNIPASGDTMQMVMGYEDGVPSRPMICQAATSFKQTSAKNITLGSPDCDLYIYRFKVYNTSLSADAILKNYIADARTGEDIISRYTANKIYNNAGVLTPESLAEACPWLRVYKIESPLFTTSKDDKVKNTTIQQIYKNGDPVLDNWTCYNAQHSGQGTSSNNYGAAGRNLDFIMNKDDSYFILGDNITRANSISLTRESVPVAYLNAKVNIASSNNLTNALIAKRYNEFNPYKRPLVERAVPNRAYTREDGNVVEIKTPTPKEYVKDTMEFYNCAIFIRETARDFSTHNEFKDDKYHFYALGNIGDSKKTDDTRATDPDDALECCVEIMDLNLALSAFPRDTMIAAMQLAKDKAGNTIEGEYVWATQENIDNGILYTAEYSTTQDSVLDPTKVYYYYDEDTGEYINASTYTVPGTTQEYIYAKEENINKLFVISDFKQTEDTEINTNKLYFVDDPEPADPNNVQKVDAWSYYTINSDTGEVEYTYINEDPSSGTLYEAIYTQAVSPIDVTTNTYYYLAEGETPDSGKMINGMGYIEIPTVTYPYLEDLSQLKEIKYNQVAPGSTLDLNNIYYVDILEHDDFSEDYTYGWRYSKNKKDTSITGPCHQAWINFYRFVTTSTDEEFKAHFDKYFVKNSALYYYLFTTRYCMVDNRAKNTFWHYGKTGGTYENDIEITNANGDILFSATAGEPIRKWDLCWDYDNDTSLGLNNYGKQAYRYGLEDCDYEEGTGIEVFRQSDSLFFCRVRDLFAAELKEMYNTLDSQGAWDAEAFINEGDAWQSQFPEALWHTDIERKYIRPYTVDQQFLENMANGKMKYHRRYWERNQEKYMASKYQTAGSLDVKTQAANFRVNTKAVVNNSAIPADYSFTLTPYAYTYLNVKYGGTSPISFRAAPNTAVNIPYHGVTPDIINIGSAAAIKDFGDLSRIYPYTASVQNATKIRTLKLGSAEENYVNTNFTTFSTGENALLEELDLTNVHFTGENKTLNLSNLINLKIVKAHGTQLQSVTFATGGKISDITLPAVTELSLISLNDLVTDKVALESFDSTVDLTITGCPNIDQLTILENCANLSRTKLDNVHFGTQTYQYFVDNIFDLQGIDGGTYKEIEVDGEKVETTNAQISGTVRFESLTGEQYNEIKTRYPNLVITYNSLTSIIKFMDTDTTTVLTPEEYQSYSRNSENKINCIELRIVPATISGKTASAEFRYELFGWSTNKNEPVVNYEQLEEGEAILAEEAARKKYNEDMLTNIEGDRVFYPVFKAIRRSYVVKFVVATKAGERILQESEVLYDSYSEYLGETPVREDVDVNEAIRYSFVGWDPKPEETPITGETTFRAQFIEDELGLADIEYTLLTGSTMAITACKNKLNDAVKIPNKYLVDGKEYAVTSIGGFNDYPALELITLPDTLISFGTNAFNMCTSLREVRIPNRVTELSQDAFSRCYELTKVDLQGDVTIIGNTCFSWCYELADINLKEGLTKIRSYAFNKCALKDVVIPSTVDTVGENAFGEMNALGTVTFKEYLNEDGTIRLPDIDPKAFIDSVTTFNVPWSRDEHIEKYGKSTFGAQVDFESAFNFNYTEGTN